MYNYVFEKQTTFNNAINLVCQFEITPSLLRRFLILDNMYKSGIEAVLDELDGLIYWNEKDNNLQPQMYVDMYS